MAGELLSGLSLFKSMMDTAKGLKDVNDAAIRNEAVIDLQEKILAAQTQQAMLSESVSNLEKEVASLKAWDAEKQRYELSKVGNRGVFVYSLKEGADPPEQPHQLCAACFADNQKSILQEVLHSVGRAVSLICHRCGAEIYTRGLKHPEHSGTRKRR